MKYTADEVYPGETGTFHGINFFASETFGDVKYRVLEFSSTANYLIYTTQKVAATNGDDVAFESLKKQFDELKVQWNEETEFVSSIDDMILNESYQKIIALGKNVIPLIIRELRREPDQWFWALSILANENPVASEHRGDIRLMAEDWIDWAVARGIA